MRCSPNRSIGWWRWVVLSIVAVVLLSTTTTAMDTDEADLEKTDVHIFVDSSSAGDDDNAGDDADAPVKTIARAMDLIEAVPRPLTGFIVVNLSGTFVGEQIRPRQKHVTGTSGKRKLVFRSRDFSNPARLLGGSPLNFVPVSSLDVDSPGRILAASLFGSSSPSADDDDDTDGLWAAPPPPDFPSFDRSLRWPDSECRAGRDHPAPPTLSLSGRVLTRARDPNLPPATSFPPPEMGEVRDAWLRTTRRTTSDDNRGRLFFDDADRECIEKASDESWDSGAVVVHMFPRFEWFDARVKVGPRRLRRGYFGTSTTQKAPGDPDDGRNFIIEAGSRFYLEGAVEYLDQPGEYHVSLGETDNGDSRGWTLLYPPEGVDEPEDAVLSLMKEPLILLDDDYIPGAFVSFRGLHVEGGRTNLVSVDYNNCVEFMECSFVNAGHDSAMVYGHRVAFLNCIFEGSGGSAVRLHDTRDQRKDGTGWGLIESRSGIVDSLFSDYARTCRHYSEGVDVGGYGTIVSNNHFRSSSMAAINVVGGGFKILHNVFSHVADGSYDTGALHWVAESPMERGNEVAYNAFFRNGVSKEPCNAATSCISADVYIDDMAGAMTIHGNIMMRDKVIQPPVSNDGVADDTGGASQNDDSEEDDSEEDDDGGNDSTNTYAPVHWLGVFVNGGADIKVYENVFVGPEDDSTSGAIYNDAAAFFVQSSGGTYYTKSKRCGHTGVCRLSPFYRQMRQQRWSRSPWADAFPELKNYEMPQSGSRWRCADTRSCPLASWNNTVVCNAGMGENRAYSNKAIWPTDEYSDSFSDAEPGKNVPYRDKALIEYGNMGNGQMNMSIAAVDEMEAKGMDAVLPMMAACARHAEAKAPDCREGIRKDATRSELLGRFNNPCSYLWVTTGDVASCDPCKNAKCSDRDMAFDTRCTCDDSEGERIRRKKYWREHVQNFLKESNKNKKNVGRKRRKRPPTESGVA